MSLVRQLCGGVAVAAIIAGAGATAAYAQDTAAGVRGVVVSESGAPVAGASITLVHTPTNTAARATTSANGSYSQSGLRIGGPYTVTVAASGYEPVVLEGIWLQASGSNPLTLTLRSAERETIVVRGSAVESIDLANGVGSSFNAADITNQPSFDRDLTSLLTRDPLVQSSGTGSLQIGGFNGRFNNLAVDGVRVTDDFGLSTSVYPSNRSPISLDSIESASVVASEYDVTSGGYIGGLVNVVTRGGSNEFDGSAYYYFTNDGMRGTRAFGNVDVDPGTFEEEEYGFTLRGPIVRDRVFFSLGYEEFTSGAPGDFASSDAQNNVDPAFFEAARQVIQNSLGYDVGGRPSTTNLEEETIRYFARFDANITDDHRAVVTYNRTEENETNTSGTSFESAWYGAPLLLESYSAQLYSDWTDNFSTTLRIGNKTFDRGQACNAGRNVGEIQLRLSAADVAGTPLDGLLSAPSDVTFVGGCDRFRHANDFNDERWTVFASGEYSWGDHLFTFGADYEDYQLYNLFASDTLGTYIFDTVAELQAANATSVAYRNVISNNSSDAAAEWGYQRWAAFFQDEWQIRPNLALTGGVRYERFEQTDVPPLREDFLAAYGRSNQDNLDGVDVIMPRFGFRYEPFDRTTITGGVGLFSGGEPHVWISNAFQPQIFSASASNVAGVDPRVIPAVLLNDIAASNPNTPTFIDTIDPDFEIPSVWKASVTVAQEFDLDFGSEGNFGNDYLLTASILYSQVNEDFRWVNLAQTDLAATQPVGVAPDGRPIYADLQDLGVDNVIELTNDDEGRAFTFAVSLSNEYDNGFGFYTSYAYTDAESVTPGSSSRAVSNFRSYITADRNNPELATSPYATEHAFTFNFSYEREFIGDLMSRVDLFGTVTSGEPFSYTFDVSSGNALFGRQGNFESPYDNDLLYVPAVSGNAFADPNVVFAPGFDQNAFYNYVQAHNLATGGIVARNDDESAWNQIWNLRFQQELPGIWGAERFVGENRFMFVLDIENVLNLLSESWGTQHDGPSFDEAHIVGADLVSSADVALNGIAGATALTGDAARTSCTTQGSCVYRFNSFRDRDTSFRDLTDSVWSIRMGLRYEF